MIHRLLARTCRPFVQSHPSRRVPLRLLQHRIFRLFVTVGATSNFFRRFNISVANGRFPTSKHNTRYIDRHRHGTMQLFTNQDHHTPCTVLTEATAYIVHRRERVIYLARGYHRVHNRQVSGHLPLATILVEFRRIRVVARVHRSRQARAAGRSIMGRITFVIDRGSPNSLVSRLACPPGVHIKGHRTLNRLWRWEHLPAKRE